MKTDFNNILIVRTDRIGDVVLTTPAIKTLRCNFPLAKISVLISPLTKDLLIGNPDINEVIIDGREREHKGLRGFVSLVQMIKQKNFDLAVIFHTKKRTNLLCFLAGIPYRLGYKNNKYGFLINHPVTDVRSSGEKHEVRYCLDLLKEIGIASDSEETFVPVHSESELWADQFLRQNGIDEDEMLVALHFGASDPSKCWPEGSFAELIQQLIEKYSCKIVIVGAKNIRPVARKIVDLTYGPIFDVTGMTTVSQLVSLLGHCSLLISNDSGPVHIAAALQVPVVSIFTRNQPGINPQRWKPLGLNSTYVAVNEDLSPSFKKAGDTDAKDLEIITPQAVLEAVDDVFKLC